MGKALTGSRRVAMCAWLAENGINPADVPQDADITIDKGPTGRFLRCQVYDRTPDGHLQPDQHGTSVATMVVNVPLKVEPPAWWQPHTKPTREQLLAVLQRVQALADEPGESNTYIERKRLRAVLSLARKEHGV